MTPPARTARSWSNSRRKPKENANDDRDDLMREIDALEGGVDGFYSTTSTFLKAPPKPDTVLGNINIHDDDVSSIGSQDDEDDDEMILSTPSSQGTQTDFFLTPNSILERSFSLTPRKTNELSLLSVPEVAPMPRTTIVPPSSLKLKRKRI